MLQAHHACKHAAKAPEVQGVIVELLRTEGSRGVYSA